MSDNFVFSREITPGYAQFYGGAKVVARPLTLAGSIRQACEMYWTWAAASLATWRSIICCSCCRAGSIVWSRPAVSACMCGFLQMCVFGGNWRQNLTQAGYLAWPRSCGWACLRSGRLFLAFRWRRNSPAWPGRLPFAAFRFALDGEKTPEGRLAPAACVAFFLGGICVASPAIPQARPCLSLPWPARAGSG